MLHSISRLFSPTNNYLTNYSFHHASSVPTVNMSRSQILDRALYAAEKSYGWKTAEVSRQLLVPFRMINGY